MQKSCSPNRSGANSQLFAAKRDKTSFVEGMGREVEAVARVLKGFPEAVGVPIRPMVVLVGAEWEWLPKSCSVRGVWIGSPKELAKVVLRSGPFGADKRQRLVDTIAARLPEA